MKKLMLALLLMPVFCLAEESQSQSKIDECVYARIDDMRESDLSKEHEKDTGMEYPITNGMIREWEEECKNQMAEAAQKQQQPTSAVDYDEAVNAMNAPYLSYRNGAYAMLNAENKCWESVGNATDAERCMAMTITGVYIERAWAMKKGRIPVPNYQDAVALKRIDDNMDKAKISEEEKQLARENLKNNGSRIIPSMVNVGALR